MAWEKFMLIPPRWLGLSLILACSTEKEEELPLFQLVLDLASLLYKYNRELMRENIWTRTLILDLHNIIKEIVFSFEKIVDLSDDLFCTGDLHTNKD